LIVASIGNAAADKLPYTQARPKKRIKKKKKKKKIALS
jgi:hypothetical protein